jgi:hypothetical protein
MMMTREFAGVVSSLMLCGSSLMWGQQPVAPAAQSPDAASVNPLQVGESAMEKRDFVAAHKFFADYVAANPKDVEAVFYLASSDLELKSFSAAIRELKDVLAAKPEVWPAHEGLVFAYAQVGDWDAFDKERALIKAAQDKNDPGLPQDRPTTIDSITVGDDTYRVFAFYKLDGHFHTRYYFIQFGSDGQRGKTFACESDDVDQTFFAKLHPKEAAAGNRSFSLDSYSEKKTADGKTTQVHGTVKFYQDGEPTYETVRADVIAVLLGTATPMSSSGKTVPKE